MTLSAFLLVVILQSLGVSRGQGCVALNGAYGRPLMTFSK